MPTMRSTKNMAVPTPRKRGQDPATYNAREFPETFSQVEDEMDTDEVTVFLPRLRLGEDVSWKMRGACLDSDVDFIPDVLNTKAIQACKAVCATCEVAKECGEFAVENDIDFFVFGGMTPKERKALRA